MRKARQSTQSLARGLADSVRQVQVRDQSIRVGVVSKMEEFRVNTYSSKEPETLDWIDQNFTCDKVFFDIGANIGLYSLYAAKKNPTGRIYAFEPESQNFARLCRNIYLNGIQNIIPCNFAISDKQSFDFYYVGETEVGSALHSFGSQTKDFKFKQGAVSFSIDGLVEKFHLPTPSLLKIDVDGIENLIIEGCKNLLSAKSIESILVELSSPVDLPPTESARTLELAGYKIVQKSDWVYRHQDVQFQNYIFKI